MKMKPIDYAIMKNDIAYKFTVSELKEYRQEVLKGDKGKDKEKLFRWNIFWMCGLGKMAVERLYDYIDDTHIDTALNKAIKEIIKENKIYIKKCLI